MKILDTLRRRVPVYTSDDTTNKLHEVYLLDKIKEIETQEEERLDRIATHKSYKVYMIEYLSSLSLTELKLVVKSDPIAERIYDYNSSEIVENIITKSISTLSIERKPTSVVMKATIDTILSDMKKLRIVK
jgi:hypothetical protein